MTASVSRLPDFRGLSRVVVVAAVLPFIMHLILSRRLKVHFICFKLEGMVPLCNDWDNLRLVFLRTLSIYRGHITIFCWHHYVSITPIGAWKL